MAIDVNIVNELYTFVQQETNFSLAVGIATILIALVSIIALGLSYKQTRTQLKLTQKEFSHKTRPIIARHVHEKKKSLPSQINDDTHSLLPNKIMFHIINNGMTTATNVSKTTYLEINSNGFDSPMLDPKNKDGVETMADLAPTEYYSTDICWNINQYQEALVGKNCRFGLLIWYGDDHDGHEYFYHMEGHFEKTALMLDYVKTGQLN